MAERIYPFLNGKLKGVELKSNAFGSYFAEPQILGEKGLHKILDQGKALAHMLLRTLKEGGSAIFPHTYIRKCGYQIAAVVSACLDSGSDQVLALGTLHPMNEAMLKARTKELNRQDISSEPSWGILGPGINRDNCWEHEFSLLHFKTLWETEVKRRGIKAPKLIEVYPHLTNRQPDRLPGIQELKKIANDSVVIATDDLCHHGIAYGVEPHAALDMREQGLAFAHKRIQEGYAYLHRGDYDSYYEHWMHPMAIGDPTDAAIVLKYLLGKTSFEILDLRLVDVTELFAGDTAPSWVAATLVGVAVT